MEEALTKIVKEIDNINVLIALFGSFDKNIELLKREFNCNISAHGAELTIIGKNTDAERCSKVLDLMRKFVEKGRSAGHGTGKVLYRPRTGRQDGRNNGYYERCRRNEQG